MPGGWKRVFSLRATLASRPCVREVLSTPGHPIHRYIGIYLYANTTESGHGTISPRWIWNVVGVGVGVGLTLLASSTTTTTAASRSSVRPFVCSVLPFFCNGYTSRDPRLAKRIEGLEDLAPLPRSSSAPDSGINWSELKVPRRSCCHVSDDCV